MVPLLFKLASIAISLATVSRSRAGGSISGLWEITQSRYIATQINVAPDGSPIFTRDTGYQEIYALNVRWP
jgi:hypothetical protein